MRATHLALMQIDPAEAWKPWSLRRTSPGIGSGPPISTRAAFGYSRQDLIEAERSARTARSNC